MPADNVLIPIYTPLIPEAAIDIVVVHGMNPLGNETHEEDVWTHKTTGTNWVRILLPNAVPNARILAYQYNANIVFGSSIPGVAGQARNLLQCLKLKRESDPSRPIIWITHSLGGIIVKEALAIASREYQAYPMISAFTDAIFFIAVPHHGSQHASCGVFAGKIARAFTFQPNNSFLASLSPGSDYNKELNTRFQPLLLRYKFYTWIEGREVPYIGLIVPEDSAKLGLPAPHEVCRITERNHRNICQFSDENDLEWLELSAHISEAASDATTSHNYSPAIDRSKELLEVRQHNAPYTGDLLEATDEAQSIVETMNVFQNSAELLEKETQAGLASEAALSLAKLLLAVISPILHVLSLSPITAALGSLLLSTVLVGLPSKNELLEKARQGQEAEETIMEVEDWAINMLNGHQRAALLASHHLQQVIDRIEFQDTHDEHALPLVKARLLQQELQTLVVRNTQNIHERQIEYQKAERIVKGFQDVKEEVKGKNKKETCLRYIEEGHRIKEGGYCPEKCVFL